MQGFPAPSVFLLQAGVVKLIHTTPGGREVISDLRLPGDFIGADSALMGQPALETAVSVGTVTLCAWLPTEFVARFKADAEFNLRVARALCLQISRLCARVAGLGLEPARGRLVALLEALAEAGPACDSDVRVLLPLKSWEIAEYLCISPFYLSRLWAELEAGGKITRERRHIWLARHPSKAGSPHRILSRRVR